MLFFFSQFMVRDVIRFARLRWREVIQYYGCAHDELMIYNYHKVEIINVLDDIQRCIEFTERMAGMSEQARGSSFIR